MAPERREVCIEFKNKQTKLPFVLAQLLFSTICEHKRPTQRRKKPSLHNSYSLLHQVLVGDLWHLEQLQEHNKYSFIIWMFVISSASEVSHSGKNGLANSVP